MNWEQLTKELKSGYLKAETGLPDEVFSYIASVTPMVNVDLLIQNDKGQVLLAWRKDSVGEGWHIPGGIIRFKETFADRIHKTAIIEIGTDVTFDEKPVKITEIFMPYQRRGHFISFLYRCHLPIGFEICNKSNDETEDGFLKWHDKCPENLMYGQRDAYVNLLTQLFELKYTLCI